VAGVAARVSAASHAEEIVSGELAAAPEIRAIVEAMMGARRSIIERIKVLEARVRAAAKQNAMARLFMTAPGVGAVIALSVASTSPPRMMIDAHRTGHGQ